MNLALNLQEARELAIEIVLKEKGGIWNWTGADKNKEYFTKTIELIRELENK